MKLTVEAELGVPPAAEWSSYILCANYYCLTKGKRRVAKILSTSVITKFCVDLRFKLSYQLSQVAQGRGCWKDAERENMAQARMTL